MRSFCIVVTLFKAASTSCAAAIADIWFFQKPAADILLKIITETITHEASAAKRIPFRRFTRHAEMGFPAIIPMHTGIVIASEAAGSFFYKAGANFFGDCSRILLQLLSNLIN